MGQEPAAPLVTASDGRTDVAGSSREAGCAWCALGSPCAGGKKTNGTASRGEPGVKTRDLLKGRPRGGENFYFCV